MIKWEKDYVGVIQHGNFIGVLHFISYISLLFIIFSSHMVAGFHEGIGGLYLVL